jgi:hypothetical protein
MIPAFGVFFEVKIVASQQAPVIEVGATDVLGAPGGVSPKNLSRTKKGPRISLMGTDENGGGDGIYRLRVPNNTVFEATDPETVSSQDLVLIGVLKMTNSNSRSQIRKSMIWNFEFAIQTCAS